MSILFSQDELAAQREAVWKHYLTTDSSAKALSVLYPHHAEKRAQEAALLRQAWQALEILRINAHWIEQGLARRMKDRRR